METSFSNLLTCGLYADRFQPICINCVFSEWATESQADLIVPCGYPVVDHSIFKNCNRNSVEVTHFYQNVRHICFHPVLKLM